MTIEDLLGKHSDSSIIARLLELYPKEQENLSGYRSALPELRRTLPKDSDGFRIAVESFPNRRDPKREDIHVGAYTDKDPGQSYSLSLTPWAEWLSMPIEESTATSFSELDILAHCLWEMTFHGYSSEEVGDVMGVLEERIESIENGTAELVPCEDVFAELGIERPSDIEEASKGD